MEIKNKTYVVSTNLEYDNLEFENFYLERSGEYFLKIIADIVDYFVQEKMGKDYSSYETLKFLIETDVLDLQDLINEYEDEILDDCYKDMVQECIDSGEYEEALQEAIRETEEEMRDWYGTRDNVLGL